MIAVLGIKRVLTLAVLVVLVMSLGGAYYYVLMPEAEKAQRQLQSTESQINTVRRDVEQLRIEYEQFENEVGRYERLKKLGFFNDQDRVLARERFKVMQDLSQVISAKYIIKPGSVEENNEAKEAGHLVLRSPINIEIEAIDDVDVYRFLYLMNYSFPGHTQIKKFSISRDQDLSQPLIRSIGNNVQEVMVKADIEVDWRTMAEEDKINKEDGL